MRTPSLIDRVLDVTAHQASWFVVVLGVTWGMPWPATVLGLVPLAAHALVLDGSQRRTLVRLQLLAVVAGLVLESVNAATGAYRAVDGSLAAGLAPPWLLVLWAGFAIPLLRSFGWASNRPALAALVGAIGGPLSFWGGARMGALTFPGGAWPYLLLAVEWAIAFPLLVAWSDRLRVVSAPDAIPVRANDVRRVGIVEA